MVAVLAISASVAALIWVGITENVMYVAKMKGVVFSCMIIDS
jgi:hypothetical protein